MKEGVNQSALFIRLHYVYGWIGCILFAANACVPESIGNGICVCAMPCQRYGEMKDVFEVYVVYS